MCYKCDEDLYDTVEECYKPDEHDICDEFSYTLTRLRILDRTPRSFWAQCLTILHNYGSVQVREYEGEFFGENDR